MSNIKQGSKKPTPAQARILRALSKERESQFSHPAIRVFFDDDDNISRVFGRDIGDLSVNKMTVKKLMENNYIEYSSDFDIAKYGWTITKEGRDILELLSEEDYISPPSNPAKKSIWKTHEILNALIEKYVKLNNNLSPGYPPKWVYFPELGNDPIPSSRIDLFVMNCWRSTKYLRISYEIKISRADFLNELKCPKKSKFARSIANQYIYVTPPGLIKLEEIKETDGLIELSKNEKLITKQKPTYSESIEPCWAFIAGMGRKLFNDNSK